MGLDHLIGRPSSAWKRFEVIMVLFTVLSMVRKYDNHPSRMPEILKRLNKFLSKCCYEDEVVIYAFNLHYLSTREFRPMASGSAYPAKQLRFEPLSLINRIESTGIICQAL